MLWSTTEAEDPIIVSVREIDESESESEAKKFSESSTFTLYIYVLGTPLLMRSISSNDDKRTDMYGLR